MENLSGSLSHMELAIVTLIQHLQEWEGVGRAITSGIPRGELFITTKLWNSKHAKGALEAFDGSMGGWG